MRYLQNRYPDKQEPDFVAEVLQSVEEKEDIWVKLAEGGSISGPITSVMAKGDPDNPEEVGVQFLNYERDWGYEDSIHYHVTVPRSDNGEWATPELSNFITDLGRVRFKKIGPVESVWPNFEKFWHSTVLTKEEARIVSMKEMGMSDGEIADSRGCDLATIKGVLGQTVDKYRKSKKTISLLEESTFDLNRRTWPSVTDKSKNRESGSEDAGSNSHSSNNAKAEWNPSWDIEKIEDAYEPHEE